MAATHKITKYLWFKDQTEDAAARRVMDAMLTMRIDIAALEQAASAT